MSTSFVVLAVSTGVVVIVVAAAVVLVVLIVAVSMRGRQNRGAARCGDARREVDEGRERAGRAERECDIAREAGEGRGADGRSKACNRRPTHNGSMGQGGHANNYLRKLGLSLGPDRYFHYKRGRGHKRKQADRHAHRSPLSGSVRRQSAAVRRHSAKMSMRSAIRVSASVTLRGSARSGQTRWSPTGR